MFAVLVNSPIYRASSQDADDYLPPLGLGYIATTINSTGNAAVILDAVQERLGVDDVVNRINMLKPDYAGINVFTPNYQLVKEIAERIAPKQGVFIGGATTRSLYGQILNWNVDCELNVIIGEGELIIPAIINGSCTQAPYVTDRNKRVFCVNAESKYFPADISDIMLDRSLFKESVLVNHYDLLEAPIVTSRGCPFDCAFCGGAHSLNPDIPIRTRTKESVITEIERIIASTPEVRSIRVLDDLFLRNTHSIYEASYIFEQFSTLRWRGMAHVAPIILNASTMNDLYKSGCQELFIGIESGADRIRKLINKMGNVEEVMAACRCILGAGIDLKAYFIYGFPGETKQDFEATYKLASTIASLSRSLPGNFRTSVFQFRPYHGTKLYDDLFGNASKPPSFSLNQALASAPGRTQFSLSASNFSDEPDDVVNFYIQETLALAER